MHCKVCHGFVCKEPGSDKNPHNPIWNETPCTKECGEEGLKDLFKREGKPKDQVIDSGKLIEEEQGKTLEEWIAQAQSQKTVEGKVTDEIVSVKAGDGCEEKQSCQHQWFEIDQFINLEEDKQTRQGIKVSCILCPEVRIKWEDGEIEVIN